MRAFDCVRQFSGRALAAKQALFSSCSGEPRAGSGPIQKYAQLRPFRRAGLSTISTSKPAKAPRDGPVIGMPKLKNMAARVTTLETRTAPLPPKTIDPFYLSREWRALVGKIKRERGETCEDPSCKGPHHRGQRIYADHVVEIQDGGAKLDARNVMLRCARSHGLKTARERAGRMRPDGYVLVSRCRV